MVNRIRGEVEAIFDGRPHTLCLTLGALAELEGALGEPDLATLVARFEAGRLSASDAVRIIGAGLRGGGHAIDDDAVGRLRADGGASGFVAIVAELLIATFAAPSLPAASRQHPPRPCEGAPAPSSTLSPLPSGLTPPPGANPDAAPGR